MFSEVSFTSLFFPPSSSTVPAPTHHLGNHSLQAINPTVQTFIPAELLGCAVRPLPPLPQPLLTTVIPESQMLPLPSLPVEILLNLLDLFQMLSSWRSFF